MALLYISNSKYYQQELINRSCAVAFCLEGIQFDLHRCDMVNRIVSGIETKIAKENTPAVPSDHPINSKDQAMEYLATCKPFTSDIPVYLTNISKFLLQLSHTHNLPRAAKNGLQATMFIVKATSLNNITNNITRTVKYSMNDMVNQLTTKTSTL